MMRLFGNLFHRSESIAQAMVARGFQGPEGHTFHMTKINTTSWLANILALTLLVIAVGIWPTALVGWSEADTAALAVRPLIIPNSIAPASLAMVPSGLVSAAAPSATPSVVLPS